MRAQEIRETFLSFFEKRGHRIVPSSSLIPKDDPTLLFTNAGMNQFKNVFLGLEKRSYTRAASVQKCLRVSGKHNDLDQVGRTTKHHTFFEMLGNFSFGDYFKEEAIAFAWELITEVFGFPEEKLYITIYEEDEEAFRLWNEKIGVKAERILRFGKKDNFWAMGETGPCGPCSEIHYDLNPSLDKGEPYDLIARGSDRMVELWNLVFMEYEQTPSGELRPLPRPSIDTGMGLERMAASLQKKNSNFETDLFWPIIDRITDLAQIEYPAYNEGDVAVRIISDHIRAITFLICDGVMPSNEGRGYVLRRLIRRAFRRGNWLGIERPFLHKLIGVVAEIMKEAYPEIMASAQYISRICLAEEERFSGTLAAGLRYFKELVADAKSSGRNYLTGAEVFKLYDTFGFPLDLTIELADEEGLVIDELGFKEHLDEQRHRARLAWKGDAKLEERRVYENLASLKVKFLGYETETVEEAEVLAILKNGQPVKVLKAGEIGEIVLDKTPFYGEAGGQIGDTGEIHGPHGIAIVEASYYPIPEIIAQKIKIISGEIRLGDLVEASVNRQRRLALRLNHTATHLLHASLRQLLGDHVKQAGSLVAPDRLRFDFTHFAPLSPKEIQRVENLVNEKIRENILVETKITTLEEGLKEGATAIFEEKYGEVVRLVKIGDFSRELCGGIHVRATGDIGLFKIIDETSVAAGIRRIEALTGEEALRYIQETENLLDEIEQNLKSSRQDILKQLEKLKQELDRLEKENRQLRQKLSELRYFEGEIKIRKIKGISVLAQRVEGLSAEELRNLADNLKQRLGQGIVILGESIDGKALLVVSITKDLASKISANELVRKIAPLIGGGGGGRADFAQAGGKNPDGLDLALEKGVSLIEEML
ncbi:MAG: alanine--tRNA ligase [Candidatus Aminicenantes bacterium]|nr:alanine--tRNA ligase [Candidatus Aminicenantes bacterium]